MGSGSRIVVVVLVLAGAVGGFLWWQRRPAPPPAPPVTAPVKPPAVPPAPPPAPAKPAIQHPMKTPSEPLPGLDDSDGYIRKALGELLGRKAVDSFLALDSFTHRLVATVNNLGSDNAASEMWPVRPTAGQFETEARGGGRVISGKNADRYAAFVRFVEGVDTARAVALYQRLYPLLQRAYEDLGFPGKYLNDRVVEVIDHLLATPEVAEPIRVKKVTVDGSARPAGTGGLYLFEDPALEASSSGRKIMLRMGRENAGKLKAKLTDVRQRIAHR